MREMQERAFENEASNIFSSSHHQLREKPGLMFLALDKTANQGIDRIIVVPEKSIGKALITQT